MKLSIFSAPKDCESYKDLATKGSAKNITAIEPYPGWELSTADVEEAKKIREYCEKIGVAIPCVSSFAFVGVPEKESEVERLKKFIDVTAALGCPYFHSTIVPYIEKDQVPPVEEVYDTSIERIKILCDYASKKNVSLLYEPQGMIFNGVEGMKKLMHDLDGAAAILLDVGNVYFVDEEPYEMARELAPLIKHVHLKDYQRKETAAECESEHFYETKGGKYLYNAKVGEGIIDFKKIFNILLDAGYDGWYSMEFGASIDAIREGADTLEAMYNEVLNNRK